MTSSDNPVLILVSSGSEQEAAEIARKLVDEKLAACVSITSPVRSFFYWDGSISDEKEYLLIIKTREKLFEEISKRILELHSYEVPEIISVPVSRGYPPYINWLLKETVK